MHVHMHAHMHVVSMINMDASMSVAICKFLYMYTCVCMHVHMCGDTVTCTQMPPPTCPLPRAAGSPKHQNSISLELIEIIRFCLKILYL